MIATDQPTLTRDMVCAHRRQMAAAAEAIELHLAQAADVDQHQRLDQLGASLWDAVAAAQDM